MHGNKYRVGDEVRVSPLSTRTFWDKKKTAPSFVAKVRYVDNEAIAVEIDQWWVFFDRYGSQLKSFYDGFQPQYILLDSQ